MDHLPAAASSRGRTSPRRTESGRSALPRAALLAAVVLLLTGLLAAGVWLVRGGATGLERAAAIAPPDAERLSWVDWAGVRADLDADLDQQSSPGEVRAFLGASYEADYSATSSLALSAPAMQSAYGISPASADWEALMQSGEGSLLVLGAEGADLDLVAERLQRSGFTAPDEDDGVWRGGFDLQARIPGELTPQVAHAVLLRDEGLVLFSDEAGYLGDMVPVVRGEEDSGIADVQDAVAQMTAGDASPLAASVLTGSYTCAELAMSQAGPEAEARAEQRIDDAGGVSPLRSFAIGLLADGAGRVALGFESDEQARENADARAALATGEAVGQGGSFEDRFSLERASASGTVVTLDLEPATRSRLLSDIASGPVLFATC